MIVTRVEVRIEILPSSLKHFGQKKRNSLILSPWPRMILQDIMSHFQIIFKLVGSNLSHGELESLEFCPKKAKTLSKKS